MVEDVIGDEFKALSLVAKRRTELKVRLVELSTRRVFISKKLALSLY